MLPNARKGVVVVGVGDAPSEASWPVALAIYGDASLRPKLGDRAARTLAGEPVTADAPKDLADLAALRAQVKGDDAASRALLAEIARRTGARAIALVFPGDAQSGPEVRIYDAADDVVEATRHRRENGNKPWGPLTAMLGGRYAPAAAAKSAEPEKAPAPATKDTGKSGGGFLSSPWFWGALGAAALAGLAAYALSRDNGSSSPTVHVDWSKK